MEGSSSDGDSMAEELAKKQKIKALVHKIQSGRINMSKETGKKKSIPAPKKKQDIGQGKGGRGKHTLYKLYIGWQHFSNEKYRVVTKTKGGGVRRMDYNADEDLTVETIIERGVKKYFPQGKSQLGYLKDMDLSLGSFAGENLERFTNTDGNACSFQEYLKSHGLFSSQYHLYIRTKQKHQTSPCAMEVLQTAGNVEERVEEELDVEEIVTDQADENIEEDIARVLLVNNTMLGNIKLKYRRKIISRYDDSECTISYGSMRQCYNSSAHETAYADYNCITDDGFLLVHLEKDDRIYLTELNDGSYQLPSFTSSADPEIIMQGPNEIYGMNDGDLMLGLITPLHNRNIHYQWFKDGSLVFEGMNASVLKVTCPGEYSVGIIIDEQMYTYEAECNVTEQLNTMKTLTQSTQSLATSQTVGIQSHTFNTQPQTLNTPPHTLNTQPQTLNTQTQAANTRPQTLNIQPQSLNTSTHTLNTQPQSLGTPQQTLNTQSQTFDTSPHSFDTQPQTLNTQPITLNTQPQTLNTQPITLNTQPQTLNTSSQTFDTQSQALNTQPQTLNTSQHTLNTSPHLFDTQPQTLSTPQQTLNTQPHTLNTSPQSFDSQPKTLNTLPQTLNTLSQTFGTQPQTLNIQLQTLNTRPHTLGTQLLPLNIQPKTLNTSRQTLNSLPQTLNTQLMTLETQPLTLDTQPQTFDNPPQTLNTQLQTLDSHPHTLNIPLQTLNTQPQTLNTQPQTLDTQLLKLNTRPQTFDTQPQTLNTQPQTLSTQPQTLSIQPHSLNTPPQTLNTPPQTLNTPPQTLNTSPQTLLTQLKTLNSQPQQCSTQPQTLITQTQTFGTSCTVPRINLADINLGKEIGRGGFGIVYEGSWIGTNVAIKEIKIKRMKIAKPLVDRELCVHSQLRHPNIVMLMAFAMESDRLYLVSELINGVTLDSCLFGVDGTTMSMSLKLNVSLKISQAVAYLHAQNPMIIHRDIKPENVLVAKEFHVVKLCDMGLSKLKTTNTIMTTVTGLCLQPGTPAYQAPEILLERQSANEMTDIWSLACTSVEVFSEMPVWNSSDEPVQYIMNRMKLKAKPDGLELLATLVDTDSENVESKIYRILDKGLSYSVGVRPHALQIVNYFHDLLGNKVIGQ